MKESTRIKKKARSYTPEEVRDFLLALSDIPQHVLLEAIQTKEDAFVVEDNFRLISKYIL